jgi:hypothetical protein
MSLTGKCLCGAIAYEVNGELPTHDGTMPVPILCHCKQCQRQSGTAFAAAAMTPVAQLNITQGNALIKRYESSPGTFRSFCSQCGSMLFFAQNSAPQNIYFSLGTLDECTLKPRVHLYVSSKAPWYDIADNLPQHENE